MAKSNVYDFIISELILREGLSQNIVDALEAANGPDTNNYFITYNDLVNGGSNDNNNLFFALLATTAPLRGCTYDNGPLNDGVGATLTGTSFGIIGESTNPGKIDFQTPEIDTIILVKNQANKRHNGLYLITVLGDNDEVFEAVRIAEYDETSEIYPSQIIILEGSNNKNKYFVQSTEDPDLGVDDIIYNVAPVPVPVSPVIFIDTVSDDDYPSVTYTSGTVPAIPASGATLIINAFGALTLKGLLLKPNHRVLFTGLADQRYNGDYIVIDPGSPSTYPKFRRLNTWFGALEYRARMWVVANEESTEYGSMYNLTSPNSFNTNQIGLSVNLVFDKLSSPGLWEDFTTYLKPKSTRSTRVATNQSIGIESTINSGGLISQGVGSTSTWIIEVGGYIVASDYNNTVRVFDKATFNLQLTAPLPGAYALSYDAVSNKIFVGSYYDGLTYVINVPDANNVITWSVDGFITNTHTGVSDVLVYNPVNDKIYAFDYNNQRIIVLNNDSQISLNRYISVPLSFDLGYYIECNVNNGDIYIIAQNGNVVAFDINDVVVLNTVIPAVAAYSEGIKYNPDNDRIYISDAGNNIYVYNGTTYALETVIDLTTFINYPTEYFDYCYAMTYNDGVMYATVREATTGNYYVFNISASNTVTLAFNDGPYNAKKFSINIDGEVCYLQGSIYQLWYTVPSTSSEVTAEIITTQLTSARQHTLQDRDGVLAHLDQIPTAPFYTYPVSTYVIGYVEPTYGNNGTAVLGDLTKPFQTINAAAVAVNNYINNNYSGDPEKPRLVYMLPGIYTETITLISNMRYYASEGVILLNQGGNKFNISPSTDLLNCVWKGNCDILEPVNYNTDTFRFENPNNNIIQFEITFNNFYAPNGTGIFFLSRRATLNTDWIKLNYNQVYIQNSNQSYVINPRLYLNLEINANSDTISESGLFFGGGANGYMGNFIYNGKNIITKGDNALSVKETLYLSQTVDDAGYIEINANLINERDTNLAMAVVVSAQSKFIKNVIINGNIIGKTCLGIQITGNRSTYTGELEVTGDIISEVSNAILFTNNLNVTNGLTFRHNGGKIESPSGFNNIQLDTGSCYTLALYQSRLKALGISDVNLDLIIDAFYSSGLNVFLYNCLLESQSLESINATNPLSINTVNSKSNKIVNVNISDNWEGIDVYPTFILK